MSIGPTSQFDARAYPRALTRTTVAAVAPWSQLLRVSWRPSFGFYERRTELLRLLDNQERLAAFRWGPDVVGARLGECEMLEVGSSGALLAVATHDGDVEAALADLALVFQLVEPADVRVLASAFQFLVPIDADYDSARATAAETLLRGVMPNEGVRDWSVLADGVSSTVSASYQVEFGIINSREALSRLSRQIGRVQVEMPVIDSDFLRIADVPPVGLFMDFRWNADQEVRSSFGDLVERWANLRVESERVAVAAYDRLGPANRQEQGIS